MGLIQGHRARFGGENVTCGAVSGTLARFGGVNETGGTDFGTPGEGRRGKRDRWGGRRDTGAH